MDKVYSMSCTVGISDGHVRCICGTTIPKNTRYRIHCCVIGDKYKWFHMFDHDCKGEKKNEME